MAPLSRAYRFANHFRSRNNISVEATYLAAGGVRYLNVLPGTTQYFVNNGHYFGT